MTPQVWCTCLHGDVFRCVIHDQKMEYSLTSRKIVSCAELCLLLKNSLKTLFTLELYSQARFFKRSLFKYCLIYIYSGAVLCLSVSLLGLLWFKQVSILIYSFKSSLSQAVIIWITVGGVIGGLLVLTFIVVILKKVSLVLVWFLPSQLSPR